MIPVRRSPRPLRVVADVIDLTPLVQVSPMTRERQLSGWLDAFFVGLAVALGVWAVWP